MDVKKQMSLRRQSSRRLSREVVPSDRISGPEGKLPGFYDMCHNSNCKTAGNDLTGKLPQSQSSVLQCLVGVGFLKFSQVYAFQFNKNKSLLYI